MLKKIGKMKRPWFKNTLGCSRPGRKYKIVYKICILVKIEFSRMDRNLLLLNVLPEFSHPFFPVARIPRFYKFDAFLPFLCVFTKKPKGNCAVMSLYMYSEIAGSAESLQKLAARV
jgi:hypothetical protein